MTNEMTQQARKRRLQDTLAIAGGGVIAFSVWDLAKMTLLLVLGDDETVSQLLAFDNSLPIIWFYVAAGVIILIDIAIRAFIGLSARAEGHGKKKGSFYLVVAVLAAMVNAASAVITALGGAVTVSVMDAVLTVIIEITAFVALALVVYCAVRLRRLDATTG